MDEALEAKLIVCLQALEDGETIESALRRYPDDVEELRPLLKTAVALQEMRIAHSVASQAASREALLHKAAELRSGARETRAAAGPLWFGRALSALVALGLFLVMAVGVLGAASAPAVPGNALYGVKRLIEDARLALANDPETQEALRAEFGDRRLDELEAMLLSNEDGVIDFRGVVSEIGADNIIVSGFTVDISGASIEGDLRVGDRVFIEAEVRGGEIFASLVRLVEHGPAPAPVATEAPTATERPTASATAPATSTATETSTPSRTPSATASRTPTASPTGTATGTPEPTLTTTPYPTHTDEPEETDEPDATDEPEETDEPAETDEPEETDEPDETEEPEPPDDDPQTPEPPDD